ncbi:hypothetical protein RAS1_30740 [Phycisphaerae bacterium RAS1]|nr:hypothetical protein RAS1_30740 [Phycisphaerae bacterium RAS1]
MTWTDPVVAEIRANAAKLAHECGDDIHALVAYFRRREQAHADQVVTRRRPARPAPAPPPPDTRRE